jgi:hypothetical protein
MMVGYAAISIITAIICFLLIPSSSIILGSGLLTTVLSGMATPFVIIMLKGIYFIICGGGIRSKKYFPDALQP